MSYSKSSTSKSPPMYLQPPPVCNCGAPDCVSRAVYTSRTSVTYPQPPLVCNCGATNCVSCLYYHYYCYYYNPRTRSYDYPNRLSSECIEMPHHPVTSSQPMFNLPASSMAPIQAATFVDNAAQFATESVNQELENTKALINGTSKTKKVKCKLPTGGSGTRLQKVDQNTVADGSGVQKGDRDYINKHVTSIKNSFNCKLGNIHIEVGGNINVSGEQTTGQVNVLNYYGNRSVLPHDKDQGKE